MSWYTVNDCENKAFISLRDDTAVALTISAFLVTYSTPNIQAKIHCFVDSDRIFKIRGLSENARLLLIKFWSPVHIIAHLYPGF